MKEEYQILLNKTVKELGVEYAKRWGDKVPGQLSLEEWDDCKPFLDSFFDRIGQLLLATELDYVWVEFGGLKLKSTRESYIKNQEEERKKQEAREAFEKTNFGQQCKKAKELANKTGMIMYVTSDSGIRWAFAPDR